MSKRGENIHKRKDGRWEARYRKGRKLDGTIIYGSVYGTTYREAKEKVVLASARVETVVQPKVREHIFKEVLLLWLEHNRIRCKGATVSKYQYLIERHIIPQLGNVKINEINATMINSFLMKKMTGGRVDQTGGLSASYVRSMMLIINGALKFAVSEQWCMPLRSPIFRPTLSTLKISVLSLEEQKRLEAHLVAGADPTGVGILLSLHTGIRIGEVCALTWRDVDLEKNILHIRHTVSRIKNENDPANGKFKLIIDVPKTKASLRDIPISSALHSFLSSKNLGKPDHFIISDSNRFVRPRTYENRYHRILNECGVEQVNYHALRHTFATRCIEAGVDVKSLSEILGHANVNITLSTYVHSSMDLKRIQLEKLESFSA